jgi:hypothetical protein
MLNKVISEVHLIELNLNRRFFSKNVIKMTDLSNCNLTIGPVDNQNKGPVPIRLSLVPIRFAFCNEARKGSIL